MHEQLNDVWNSLTHVINVNGFTIREVCARPLAIERRNCSYDKAKNCFASACILLIIREVWVGEPRELSGKICHVRKDCIGGLFSKEPLIKPGQTAEPLA